MLRYPADARERKKQGRVIVAFIVEKNGLLSSIRVLRGVWPSIDKEAVYVMSQSPNWIPAYLYGIAISVSYALPVSFTLAYEAH